MSRERARHTWRHVARSLRQGGVTRLACPRRAARRPRRFPPAGCQRLADALGGGSGGECYFVPAITPWAGRARLGQWRRRVSIGEVLTAARSQAGLTITQV